MGTDRAVLGYVIEMKPWRKGGNGPIGSGRLGGTGKRCKLYKVAKDGTRELIETVDESTAKHAVAKLRSKTGLPPTHVTVNGHGETSF